MARSRSGGTSGSRAGGGRSSLSGGRGRSMGGGTRPGNSVRPPSSGIGGFGQRNNRPSSGRGKAFAAGMLVNQMAQGRRRRGFFPMGHRRMPRGGGMGGGGSLLGSIIFIFIILFAIAFIFGSPNAGANVNVPVNTTNREAIDLGIANQNAPTITDTIGMVDNHTIVNNAIRSFHNVTGIWVSFYITDNIGGDYIPVNQISGVVDDYTLNIFDTYLQSGANMLIFIYDDGNDWDIFTRVGNQATLVMDSEAEQILIAYLETHWFSDATESQVLQRTLNDTGNRIMSVDRPLWFYIAIAAIPLAIVFIAFLFYKARNKRKREKESHDERILAEANNVDLNVKDNELENILEHYENKGE